MIIIDTMATTVVVKIAIIVLTCTMALTVTTVLRQ